MNTNSAFLERYSLPAYLILTPLISLAIASLYHTAQSFFVIVNDGISGPQQSWLLAIANIALAFILVLLSGLALMRGPSGHPAAVGEIQPVGPRREAGTRT